MIRSIVTGAVALLLMPAAAQAQGMYAEPMDDQDRGAPPVVMPYPSTMPPPRGYDAPDMPMQSGYQRMGYGSTLPRQWVDPAYFLGDFDAYDLPVPAAGFGWSRYYGDAVLTDQFGRVYDVRHDFARRSRHRRHRYDDRRAYEMAGAPHWDMGYFEGRGPSGYGYGYGPSTDAGYGYGETVTTRTTTTSASRPVRTQTVRYETVSTPAPRRIVTRRAVRGKYVRVAR